MNQTPGNNRARGLELENAFLWKAKSQGATLFKIPLGAKQVGKNRLIRIETPFDWILIKNGKTAFIDTKRIAQGNLTKSKITHHQAHALYLCHLAGSVAGYIVWHEDKDQMIFYSAQQLLRIINGIKEIGLVLGGLLNFNIDLIWKEDQTII